MQSGSLDEATEREQVLLRLGRIRWKGRRTSWSCGALRAAANDSSGANEETQHHARVLLSRRSLQFKPNRVMIGRGHVFTNTGRNRLDWSGKIHPVDRPPVTENAARRGGVSCGQCDRAMESFALEYSGR